MEEIIIYTDGSCLKNPGRGGWAAVIESNGTVRELSGGAVLSTNNRMEITAAIQALRSVSAEAGNKRILLYSDSQLLVKSIELGWAKKWRSNGWKRNKKDKAENPDLWEQLLREVEKLDVVFVWTKAHVGTAQNERCDELAKAAAEMASMHDEVYERSQVSIDKISGSETVKAVGLSNGYSVLYDALTSVISISHPVNGSMNIKASEVTPLLEQMREVVRRSQPKR